MIKSNKLFKNGLLTPKGKEFVSDFRYGLTQIMESDEVREMSSEELNTLQYNLTLLVSNAINKMVDHNKQFISELNAMTDKEFYTHLEEKYGSNWILHSLEKEERERLPDLQKLADEHKYIGEAIAEHMFSKGVRFKK